MNVTLPKTLKGFEHINRYYDRQLNVATAKILPGEYYVTQSSEIITTVLGSCISVCIFDLDKRVGGMNHFMLPGGNDNAIDLNSYSFRYGDVAMERLINDVIKAGGARYNLCFKAFGGGQIIRNMTSIGTSNIDFLNKFLALEGFRLTASDMGGRHPRKVRFDPMTGKVWIKKLEHLHNDTITEREESYRKTLSNDDASAGDVELFD
jgi:chemotaxis protein CheD